jgi:hypothetical protein
MGGAERRSGSKLPPWAWASTKHPTPSPTGDPVIGQRSSDPSDRVEWPERSVIQEAPKDPYPPVQPPRPVFRSLWCPSSWTRNKLFDQVLSLWSSLLRVLSWPVTDRGTRRCLT